MSASSPLAKVAAADRYCFNDHESPVDAISGERPNKLRYGVGGAWKQSKTSHYTPCYDPSTGAVIALAPECTAAEVHEVIEVATKAFPAWRDTPVSKRIQVLFKLKTLLEEHLDEL